MVITKKNGRKVESKIPGVIKSKTAKLAPAAFSMVSFHNFLSRAIVVDSLSV